MAKLNGKKYDLSKGKDRTEYWTNFAADKLVGKKIIKVEYFSNKEAEESMWYSRPLCFQLDDGTWVYPMRDDEGNDGGAMAYIGEKANETFPVLGVDDE
tara:strand:- start:1001 stop:1297 length:297 start_codon:yes stop_codon:yes gene_type:complete